MAKGGRFYGFCYSIGDSNEYADGGVIIGRYVAFVSMASNLVCPETYTRDNIFFHIEGSASNGTRGNAAFSQIFRLATYHFGRGCFTGKIGRLGLSQSGG